MSCLSFISMSKLLALSSLNNNNSQPSETSTNPNPVIPSKTRRRNQQKPRRPSVLEIERAIGAGRFRDTDPRDLEEQKKTSFDMFSMNFTGKFEGPVMKRLRETGEWITTQTESRIRSSGKTTLIFVFQCVLPIWVFSLLVASGVIKLPFSTPFLDDLLT